MLDLIYHRARTRVSDLAATLSNEQLRAPVPATPRWTVRQLLAHLVGGATDAVSGRLDGVTSEPWTARHVAERRCHSVGDLLAEWDRIGPAAEFCLPQQQVYGPNLAADLICHEADLREALGLARVDREHWDPFLEVMMLFLRKQLRHTPTLLIRDEQGQQWSCGSGEPTTMLRADGYELLRATFSRRSQRQIAAWNWTPTPPAQMIERFGCFGPRDDDQPIPVA
jgi:uncharacterized protein (TIGR03083 family)